MPRSRYLVLYDYGQGGLWAVIFAKSKDDLNRQFRDLVIYDYRPFWMTDEFYMNIEKTSSYDSELLCTGWLEALRLK